ncbi:spermatogenesis-associated serine-rich protein 1 [Salmo salar]|uniref:Spermatogenesis-associated serine-rich protein 1 n=1 Tax=Salmo salar TaxID=8030 RepID=A0A1S3MAT5_SALSA|nr:spermatogenesis-associated serine-rich protein 1 [Salmo salar]|eukprot:XP_014000180.1 PREDICTED: spermatogenesis-associated serine-rich protein 1 [Salmo salar]
MCSFGALDKLGPQDKLGHYSHGGEIQYRPHIRHIEPNLTECDLDWSSGLRWLPAPRYSDAPLPHIKLIKFPEETRLLRSFPQANMVSQTEWTFYPNFGQPRTFHVGKRCLLEGGHHYRTIRCSSERTLEATIGRKKQARFTCHSAPGSRPYLTPEYSPDFHKFGSTLATTHFGSLTFSADTFVPLQPPPKKTCIPYVARKRMEDREADILEVKKLSKWRPAPVIFKTVLDN